MTTQTYVVKMNLFEAAPYDFCASTSCFVSTSHDTSNDSTAASDGERVAIMCGIANSVRALNISLVRLLRLLRF